MVSLQPFVEPFSLEICVENAGASLGLPDDVFDKVFGKDRAVVNRRIFQRGFQSTMSMHSK